VPGAELCVETLNAHTQKLVFSYNYITWFLLLFVTFSLDIFVVYDIYKTFIKHQENHFCNVVYWCQFVSSHIGGNGW